MKMKTGIFKKSALILFIGLLLLAFCTPQAVAYDKKKCAKNVKKLKTLLKPYKSLKIKKLIADIDEMDDTKGGMSPKEAEEKVEPPFEELSFCKKFIKYLNQVEKHCTKEEK